MANDSTYFTCVNSLFESGPGYFKIHANEEWIDHVPGTAGFWPIHNTVTDNPSGFGGDSNLAYDLAPRIFPLFIPSGSYYTSASMVGRSVKMDIHQPPLQSGEAKPEDVYLFGDIVIPSGTIFEVKRGGTVHVSPDVIGSNLGGYTDKNEIIVNGGSMVLNSAKIASFATSPSAGDWGQIKITNNGTLTVGDSVSVSDAMIGFNIDSGGSNIDFPSWNGTTVKKCTISNCQDWGMLITSNASDITNIEFDGNGTTDYHGSLCIMSGSSAPTISHVTITGSTVYGAYVTNYSNMNLGYSKFDSSIQRHMVFLYSPSTSLSLLNGHNNFIYNGDGTYHAIWNPSSFTLNVNGNYWNHEANPNKLFENPAYIASWTVIDSLNVGAGAYKVASPFIQIDLFADAEQLEKNGSLNAARDIYLQILSSNDNPHDKSQAIKSLIRVYEADPTVADMQECGIVLSEQSNAASGWYKALLDYLQCDLIVKEASKEIRESSLSTEEMKARYRDKIAEAIHQFVTKSEEYVGTDMQVEMLSRAAVLYGDYLHNQSSAKTYADKAAFINPGQPILLSAYQAAGIEYDPWKYTDIYFGKEIGDQPSYGQLNEDSAITISPNPFNPSTTIAFSLNLPSQVKISIYSINGQKVADLTNKMMSAGRHSVVFDGSKYSSGVYFYRFESGGNVKTGKMLMVK
ncbi:MAG: T9SS type A sorting domain-containing protein [Candidatus Latescibacterota bacterium]